MPEVGKLWSLAGTFGVSCDWLLNDGMEMVDAFPGETVASEEEVPSEDIALPATTEISALADDTPTSFGTEDAHMDGDAAEAASTGPFRGYQTCGPAPDTRAAGSRARMRRYADRWGWLLGLPLILGGCGIAFFGAVWRGITGMMFQRVELTEDFLIAEEPLDDFSAIESLPEGFYNGLVTNEVPNSLLPDTGTSYGAPVSILFSVIGGALLIFGVLLIIGGIVLSVYLWRRGRKKNKAQTRA